MAMEITVEEVRPTGEKDIAELIRENKLLKKGVMSLVLNRY